MKVNWHKDMTDKAISNISFYLVQHKFTFEETQLVSSDAGNVWDETICDALWFKLIACHIKG